MPQCLSAFETKCLVFSDLALFLAMFVLQFPSFDLSFDVNLARQKSDNKIPQNNMANLSFCFGVSQPVSPRLFFLSLLDKNK